MTPQRSLPTPRAFQKQGADSIRLTNDFSYTRKYASRKKGIPEGEKETFTRRIYLHLFFNPTKRVEEDAALDHDLLELKNQLEEGTSVEELSASGQEKAAKYLQIRHYGSKTTVAFNEKAIRERKEENGYFALVSNCEKEPFECLSKYRRRETIESFFEAGKQHADGTRSREWFDTVEEVRISSKLRAKRWTTEITKRDRLFLQKLGIAEY